SSAALTCNVVLQYPYQAVKSSGAVDVTLCNVPGPPVAAGHCADVLPAAHDSAATRNPRSPGERYPRHRCRLDGECGQILALEVMDVLLAAGTRNHGQLHVQRLQIVAHSHCAYGWLETLLQNGVLRGDAYRTTACLAVVA